MATTQNTFNGNGSNLGPFSFTFKWLESTDIKVSVGGVLKTAGTHYNLQGLNYTTKTGGQVLFTAGNAPPTGTNNIRIYRDTDDEVLSAAFSSGSAIRAKDLNDNFTQNLYVTQEINNNALNVDGSNAMVGNLDINNFKVINSSAPLNGTDLANKTYVDDRVSTSAVAGSPYFLQDGAGAVNRSWSSKLKDVVSVKDFGAVGDGVADDTAAIQAAIDAVSTAGGGTVRFTDRHLIDASLEVKDCVRLEGPLGQPDEILPSTAADYDGRKGVLVINPAATITFRDSSSLSGCIVIRKGLDLPFANATAAATGVAAFTGTALTIGGAGVLLDHLLILGFNKAIYSANNERLRLEYVNGDCTNGVDIDQAYDICYFNSCHFWPFTTTHQSWTTDALLTRSGTAYDLETVTGSNDWSKLNDCFCFGYQNGFLLRNCGDVHLDGCAVDGPASITQTGVAFGVRDCGRTVIDRPIASQYGVGVRIQTSSSYVSSNPLGGGGLVRVTSASIFTCDTAAVELLTGRLELKSSFIDGANSTLDIRSPNGADIQGNMFVGVTTPITFANAADSRAKERTIFAGNSFDNCTSAVNESRLLSNAANTTTNSYVFSTSGVGKVDYYNVAAGNVDSFGFPGNTTLRQEIASVFGGTNVWNPSASWRIQAEGSPGATNSGGSFFFATTQTTTTSLVDRLKLNNNGSLFPLSDNAYDLGVGAFRWKNVYAANGTIQTSDLRTKTDVQNATLGLEFINNLRPVSYRFNEGSNDVVTQIYRDTDGKECAPDAPGAVPAEIIVQPKPGTRTHWGLISQEVKAAADAAGVDFGGWVLTDKDDPDSQQALRYDQFIAPLIKAVQELSEEVKSLKSRTI